MRRPAANDEATSLAELVDWAIDEVLRRGSEPPESPRDGLPSTEWPRILLMLAILFGCPLCALLWIQNFQGSVFLVIVWAVLIKVTAKLG